MNESAKFTLVAAIFLLSFVVITFGTHAMKVLARISFILIRMIEPFKGCMGKLAIISATDPCFLIVRFTFLSKVEILIGRSSVIERLMGVDAMVPIMIF